MRSLHPFVVAATTLVALVACRGSDAAIETTSDGETNRSASTNAAATRGNAMVRVVHVADGVRLASIRLDGQTLFDSVRVESVTDYREVPHTPRARFSVRLTGAVDTTPLASIDPVLMDGTRYSMLLFSENMSTRRLRLLKDEVIPDSGKARLRVVHAAAGGPPIDVRPVGGVDDLFSGLAFDGDAGVADVAPGTMTLEVRATGKPAVLLRLPTMTLDRRSTTTVVLHGAAALRAYVFVDAMMATVGAR
ncbi:MAG: DUF4397 domain-containing protein [Gemmatimonadaceae bacterium]|jgi:hypothetical protein|nr:DUF4397 domain-containing protein [Gemmatimonadaceae bacterium]